ncbi:MAG TPA: site-2 protease family protein [Solimonas sp.]|nr:site-2 protease family protein [Solimonas sp.]
MSFDSNLVQDLAIWALPVLFALTGHALVTAQLAYRLGDRSAAAAGKLSWNPLRYVDLVGTVLAPAIMIAVGGFVFGWPKILPVDTRAFANPRRALAQIAAAGLAANIAMALAWGVLLKVALGHEAEEGTWLAVRYMAIAGVRINLAFLVFSCLPIPGMPGGRILSLMLPARWAQRFDELERHQLLIVVALLALMASGVLNAVLIWPLMLAEAGVFIVLGINPNLLL